VRPYLKEGWGVPQVVQHLLSKEKTQNSNPGITTKPETKTNKTGNDLNVHQQKKDKNKAIS
jgi:hypothetical protein